MTLTWDDPGDSSITGHQVLRRSRDGSEYGDGEGAAEFAVIAGRHRLLGRDNLHRQRPSPPRTRYVYRVLAINPVGNERAVRLPQRRCPGGPGRQALVAGTGLPPQRRAHPRRRPGLGRCRNEQPGLGHDDSPHRRHRRGGRQLHRRPFAVVQLHGDALWTAHGALRVANLADLGHPQRLRPTADRPGPPHAGHTAPGSRVPHRGGRQVAPRHGLRPPAGRPRGHGDQPRHRLRRRDPGQSRRPRVRRVLRNQRQPHLARTDLHPQQPLHRQSG